MPDRQHELLRQRQLVQEHLAWLDREIALAADSPESPPATAVSLVANTPPGRVGVEPDAILSQYQRDPGSLQSDVRRGCIVTFLVALALLAGTVSLAYFIYLRSHRVDPDSPPKQVSPAEKP